MESAEDVEQGRQALLSLKPLLEERCFLAPIVLELQGLSHFRQQVLRSLLTAHYKLLKTHKPPVPYSKMRG